MTLILTPILFRTNWSTTPLYISVIAANWTGMRARLRRRLCMAWIMPRCMVAKREECGVGDRCLEGMIAIWRMDLVEVMGLRCHVWILASLISSHFLQASPYQSPLPDAGGNLNLTAWFSLQESIKKAIQEVRTRRSSPARTRNLADA